MASLPITIFADFSCPFSYVTETALRAVAGTSIEIDYRAHELFPEPSALEPPITEGEAWQALGEMARELGILLAAPSFRPRTRKAHEAARFGRSLSREAELRDAIYAAYWRDLRDIGRIDVLLGVAREIGIEAEELKIALDIDRYEEEVQHDGDVGQRIRIPGTPTLFLGQGRGARVVAGAHDTATLSRIIEEFESTWISRRDNG